MEARWGGKWEEKGRPDDEASAKSCVDRPPDVVDGEFAPADAALFGQPILKFAPRVWWWRWHDVWPIHSANTEFSLLLSFRQLHHHHDSSTWNMISSVERGWIHSFLPFLPYYEEVLDQECGMMCDLIIHFLNRDNNKQFLPSPQTRSWFCFSLHYFFFLSSWHNVFHYSSVYSTILFTCGTETHTIINLKFKWSDEWTCSFCEFLHHE